MTSDLPDAECQPMSVTYGLWKCGACHAEIVSQVMEHAPDCSWIASIRAAEREACAAIPQHMADHPGSDMVLGMDEVRCALREAAWKIRNRGES